MFPSIHVFEKATEAALRRTFSFQGLPLITVTRRAVNLRRKEEENFYRNLGEEKLFASQTWLCYQFFQSTCDKKSTQFGLPKEFRTKWKHFENFSDKGKRKQIIKARLMLLAPTEICWNNPQIKVVLQQEEPGIISEFCWKKSACHTEKRNKCKLKLFIHRKESTAVDNSLWRNMN